MTSPNVVIGFDFGMSKIGVAVGQAVTQTASPLTLIKATDGIPDWTAIQKLIDEWHAEALIIGLPLNMDGSEQEITLAARKFARRLENKFTLPVFMHDERLSTKEATYELKKHGNKSTLVDSYAAVLILESWLRENNND